MKLIIISFERNFLNYENQSLKNECLKQGINLKFIDPYLCNIELKNKKQIITYKGIVLENIDCALIRVGCMIDEHITYVINALKYNGCYVTHLAQPIKLFSTKFSMHQKLLEMDIDTIDSISFKETKPIINDFPIVLKSDTGSLGMGIYLINNYNEFNNMYNHSKLLDKTYNYFSQKFIDYEFGTDLRVFVVNRKIIKVMKRQSDGIDFRANYTLHSNASTYEINSEIENIVNKICNEFDCLIYGIDLLKTKTGYVVCEINSAPGYEGLETVYKQLNVSKIIIDEIKKKRINYGK